MISNKLCEQILNITMKYNVEIIKFEVIAFYLKAIKKIFLSCDSNITKQHIYRETLKSRR